ncbi:MAG: hypothetical protein II951_10470 [Bacteroidales bacterium]|nr:hypothetical protein [Bacteroidales bacterium]
MSTPLDSLTKVALLGTASSAPQLESALSALCSAVPPAAADSFSRLAASAPSPEDSLLRLFSAAHAYDMAGLRSVRLPGSVSSPSQSAPESRPYAPKEICAAVRLCLSEKYYELLLFILRQLKSRDLLLPYHVLYDVFSLAYCQRPVDTFRHKLRVLLDVVGGNRVAWLKSVLADSVVSCSFEDYHTSSLPERVALLSVLRSNDPSAALDLLRSDFGKDSVNSRFSLLECLREKLSKADEPFLLDVMRADKSEKVVALARELFLLIPDSSLVLRCADYLRSHLSYSRLFRHWKYSPSPDAADIFRDYGLDTAFESREKVDPDYLLAQMTDMMPPSFWVEMLDCKPEDAPSRMLSATYNRHPLPFSTGVINNRDSRWACAIISHDFDSPECLRLLPLLPPSDLETVGYKVIRNLAPRGARIEPEQMAKLQGPWGPNFSGCMAEYIYGTWTQGEYSFTCPIRAFESVLLKLNVSCSNDILTASADERPNKFTNLFRQLLLVRTTVYNALCV